MKLFKVTRVTFKMTLSVLLCTAVLTSCGSSKDSKTSTPIVGPTPSAPPSTSDGVPSSGNTIPQPTTPPQGTPQANPNGAPVKTADPTTVSKAAPIGKVKTSPTTGSSSGQSSPSSADSKTQTTIPDFKDSKAVVTGAKLNDLNYTSFSDDGLMEAFRTTAMTVSAEQQKLNKILASAITGARLKKNGADMLLDLATLEKTPRIYQFKATTEGNRMKLSLLKSTGELEFQGGFLKCLEVSCEDAFVKIKLQGAYTRIIFRTNNMNNNFRFDDKTSEPNIKLWQSYVYNTIQNTGGSSQIISMRAATYEVLNGKSAMGVQMLTGNNEAFSVGTLLLAPEAGTELNQPASKYADPSQSFNLSTTAGKTFTLSKAVSAVSLVNNNGKGDVKLKLTIDSGAIWMVLSRVPKVTMTPAEVKTFEATVPNF